MAIRIIGAIFTARNGVVAVSRRDRVRAGTSVRARPGLVANYLA